MIERDGQAQTIPLEQVTRIERKTHHVRNGVLWGLIVGFAGGYLGSCGQGDEEDCWPEIGALFAGIGAGTGALIGAGINRATAESRVLYSAPQSTISVAPRVSPSRASVEMTFAFDGDGMKAASWFFCSRSVPARWKRSPEGSETRTACRLDICIVGRRRNRGGRPVSRHRMASDIPRISAVPGRAIRCRRGNGDPMELASRSPHLSGDS